MNSKWIWSAVWAGGIGVCGSHAVAERPNVLFIAVDDLSTWISPMQPGKNTMTPHLEKLAAVSMLFRNAHCPSPSCHPSRAAVMTGISPLKTGITRNIKNASEFPSWRLSPVLKEAVTIPEYFKSIGYSVKGAGKIFHGNQYDLEDENDPAIWDEFYPSKTRQIPDQPVPPFDYFAKNKSEGRPAGNFDWTPLDVPDEEMSDYKVVSWVLDELSRDHDEPFFIAAGIYRPHVPFQVPRKYYDLYPLDEIEIPPGYPENAAVPFAITTDVVIGKWGYHVYHWAERTGNIRSALQGYLASMTFADAMIGRLLDGLRNSPHAGNTVVVLWSDHGYQLAERDRFEKFTLWKEATQVPLLIRVPGMTAGGSICSRAVNLLDLYPTLVELTGGALPAELDGVSLVPWLKDPELPKESPSVIVGPEPGSWAAVTDQYRYIHYFNGMEELYDVRRDPEELYNLSEQESLIYVKEYFKNLVPRQVPEFLPASAILN